MDISHENRNQIEAIKDYLHNNQSETAETELGNLLKRVEKTREYPFCTIPIINAILSEKQKECEENQILLEVDLQIPEESRIRQMDLCSVFGNLLDNAIRAGKQVVSEECDAKVRIHLLAGVKGNYMIIKCDNPYAKEPSDVPEGSGYGLKILRDIAEKYDGDFKTEFAQQKFHASLILNYR